MKEGSNNPGTTCPALCWRRCFLLLVLLGSLGAGSLHALEVRRHPWRQVRTALSMAMMSTSQEDRWLEQEVRRYAPGRETSVLDGKNSDYIKLVVAPLLLFILALAVVRLRDF